MSDETPGESVIEALWRDYKQTASQSARDRLILHYSPLVKFVAGRVGVGLPQSVDQADLASYGVFGLIDARDRLTQVLLSQLDALERLDPPTLLEQRYQRLRKYGAYKG